MLMDATARNRNVQKNTVSALETELAVGLNVLVLLARINLIKLSLLAVNLMLQIRHYL